MARSRRSRWQPKRAGDRRCTELNQESGWLQLGIEEEFQIIGPDGRLVSHIEMLLSRAAGRAGEQLKPEMLQSMVESGTRICPDIHAARREVVRLRTTVADLLRQDGLRMACAATHPFSEWVEQRVTEKDRYLELEENLQDVVRNILIFALHVHVSIPDRERRIAVMNAARQYLPILLALSTSSPFWRGRNTGLKSYRSVIWSRLPRTGIPPQFESATEFDRFVDLLKRSHTLDEGTKIWWDIRPHVVHPTLEFRVCDAPTRVEETLCIAALTQALCAHLLRSRRPEPEPRWMPILMHENKFRVMRHGLDANLYDVNSDREVPVREMVKELLEELNPVLDELGSRREAEYAETILRDGTSADRQLRVLQESGEMSDVVDNLAAEAMEGVAAA